MKIGMIGLGIMGKPMAKNLLKAGYDLTVSKSNRASGELVQAGAKAASNQEIGETCGVVLTMVPMMGSAEELAPVNIDWYFGQDPTPDFELVNQAVNEYLTEKINATVTFHGGTGDEYWGNMVVRINAGEDLGIIGFGSQTKLDYVVRSPVR